MSLYGALFAGVAGLTAQSNKLGIISDNVANVNTVGYKSGAAQFATLVVGSAGTAAYSPGGVIGSNAQLVSTQGLLTTTSSPTDIAISGNGFFIVNQKADQTGSILYTRAGSFIQDSSGNFKNSAGLFLQAWPLDRDGNLPGAPGNLNTKSSANLTSLETVNVQNLTGTASPTTNVSLGANLKSSQSIFLGAGATLQPETNDSSNATLKGSDLIIPTAIDSLTRGDQFTVTTGVGQSYTYNYGGFSRGREVTAATAGDSGTTLLSGLTTLGVTSIASVGTGSADVVVTHTAHGMAVGDVVTLQSNNGVGTGISSAQLTGSFVVKAVTANTYTITTAGTDATVGGSTIAASTIKDTVRPYTGNILDAQNAAQTFLGLTGTSQFLPSALTFKITTAASGTVTFTYKATSPNAALGQFNSLTNLADAINQVNGLTARVASIGSTSRLYVGPTDANAAITFADGASAGSGSPGSALAPIHWVDELGLANQALGLNRYSTLNSLATLVNASTGLTATVNNPLSTASLKINLTDPLDTVQFSDKAYGGTPNVGSPLAELGLITSYNSVVPAGAGLSTANLGPAYDPTSATKNMASGSIAPQFSRPITIYDALGTAHNLVVGFLKSAANTWQVEIYAQTPAEISTSLPSGLIAYGNVKFNGDGSLQSVSSGLIPAGGLAVNWTNGASASTLNYSFGTAGRQFGSAGTGTIGLTDGLSQFNSDYNVNFANQNGAPVGQLTGISIDPNGYIIASYSNGETSKLYKIPLGSFTNPNDLASASGDSFTQTNGSGVVNLKQAGASGVGTISSGALEASNVELASQLTDMIVAQRAYQANTKIIQTADTLLQSLDQIIQ